MSSSSTHPGTDLAVDGRLVVLVHDEGYAMTRPGGPLDAAAGQAARAAVPPGTGTGAGPDDAVCPHGLVHDLDPDIDHAVGCQPCEEAAILAGDAPPLTCGQCHSLVTRLVLGDYEPICEVCAGGWGPVLLEELRAAERAAADDTAEAQARLADLDGPGRRTRAQRAAEQRARREVWAWRAARIAAVTAAIRAETRAAVAAEARRKSQTHRAAGPDRPGPDGPPCPPGRDRPVRRGEIAMNGTNPHSPPAGRPPHTPAPTPAPSRAGSAQQHRWWVSWWQSQSLGGFELPLPWWFSGFRDDDDSVCAAVVAATKDAAREAILSSYDVRPADLEWRFVEEMPADWSPFSDRFPRADWMRWPAEGDPVDRAAGVAVPPGTGAGAGRPDDAVCSHGVVEHCQPCEEAAILAGDAPPLICELCRSPVPTQAAARPL